VDNTPPSLVLSAPFDTLSPNGDGNQDTLPLRQSASTTEDEWQGEIRTASGQAVRHVAWSGAAADWDWDGRDDTGALVPDGAYDYVVSATDRAGNKASFALPEIHVDTRPGAVTLTASPAAFSPNADGVLDTTTLRSRAENPADVERWRLDVRAADGSTARSFSGTGAPPAELVFDGRDDGGRVLADGQYDARIELWYRNGDIARATSPRLAIDTRKPEARVSAAALLFSPDGDGNADTVAIRQESSDEIQWEGSIRNSAGTVVLTRYWQGIAGGWEWDGRDAAGRFVPDGTYRYDLRSTDSAGNSGGAALTGIVVDARPTPVSIASEFSAFAAAAGARRPSLRLFPAVTVKEGIESWNLAIQNAARQVVRTFSGTGDVPASVVFDGKDDAGTVLPDGTGYRAVLRASYEKGDKPEASSPTFAIKSVPPVGSVSADATVFSPDGDGRNDVVTLRQSGSSEDLWVGSIMSSSGLAILSESWRGMPATWVWDGKDANGTVVPDGTYRYSLSATDAADNSTVVTLQGIRVDTRGGTATLEASAPGLSPNGDGVADVVTFRAAAHPKEGIKSWNLAVLDGRRGLHRVFSGAGARGVPAEIVWDGRSDAGRVVEGSYRAELTVEYERGTVARASLATQVVVDVTGPRVAVSAGPLPFSPDGDGTNDALSISVKAATSTSLSAWSLELLDPEGNAFAGFAGTGAPPAALDWDGRSPTGELVQSAADYTLVATATDLLGNTGRATAIVPVDILVIKDGDRLRIAISSIYFKEFTADYRSVPADRARRNLETLDRLAQTLSRFPQYAIGIEGHAVRVYWNDPKLLEKEERETLLPLSTARAEAVKQALVERGIAADRMTTVGYGGSQPVVPHGDQENNWKNRRVEFVLVRR
jgi:flagellar hook assembly protein FlgD